MNDPETFSRLLSEASEAVAAEYDADVFLYSGPIDDRGYGKVTSAISRAKSRTKALLILTTYGGSANVAYQIARLFQKMYEEFIIFCPSSCKSAGTLLSLGAHRLIMDAFSELGPLDVQLLKQNELGARKSGLLARSSFEALGEASFELYEQLMMSITMKSGGLVSFALASELSASMASKLMAPVYQQVNPEVVGSEHRDLNVALEYGIRLIKCSRNADLEAVHRLVRFYPSHDFIIDSDEAEELFDRVEVPSESLYALIAYINELAYQPAQNTFVKALTTRTAEETSHVEHPTEDAGGGAKSSTFDEEVDGDRNADRGSNSGTPANADNSGGNTPVSNGDAHTPDSEPSAEKPPRSGVGKRTLR